MTFTPPRTSWKGPQPEWVPPRRAGDSIDLEFIINNLLPESPRPTSCQGTPGLSLANSGLGAPGRAGQSGELRSAKFLSHAGVIDDVTSWWSCLRPDPNDLTVPDGSYRDIDVIFTGMRGNTPYIVLADFKNYISGDCTYVQGDTWRVLVRDNRTGKVIKLYNTSTNIGLSQALIKSAYPFAQVSAYVVLAPTAYGTPQIDGVHWPGNIPLIDIYQLVDILRPLKGNVNPRYFRRLLYEV